MDQLLAYALFLIPAFLLLFVFRIALAFLHELGHAVVAILLTRDKATVYIGSYGDPRNSLTFRSRWIDIWFKYNPVRWRYGVCIPHAAEISWNKGLLIALAGPLIPFVIGAIFYYVAFAFDMHSLVKWIAIFAFLVFLFDTIVNLVPRERPIQLYDGRITYNDGHRIRWLLRNRDVAAKWAAAIESYNGRDYVNAAALFDEFLRRGFESREIYRLAISACLAMHNIQRANELNQVLEKQYDMEWPDFSNSGLIKSQLECYEEGLADYERALKMNPDSGDTLNNRGYTLNLLGRYSEAIKDFDRAIELVSEAAYSYNNRGLARIKLGMVEAGLADISHSITLDEGNSYAYKNLGIYHFGRNEFVMALELFEKARELNRFTHQIDHYITLTQQRIDNADAS